MTLTIQLFFSEISYSRDVSQYDDTSTEICISLEAYIFELPQKYQLFLKRSGPQIHFLGT